MKNISLGQAIHIYSIERAKHKKLGKNMEDFNMLVDCAAKN